MGGCKFSLGCGYSQVNPVPVKNPPAKQAAQIGLSELLLKRRETKLEGKYGKVVGELVTGSGRS